MTKILTLVVEIDDGCVETHYGVEHEGKVWLVPTWLMNFETDKATPQRMIRVDTQPIRQCAAGGQFDYSNIALPRDVIEGDSQDTPGYEVRNLPDSPIVDRCILKILPSVFPRH